jgi:hypothetical protein
MNTTHVDCCSPCSRPMMMHFGFWCPHAAGSVPGCCCMILPHAAAGDLVGEQCPQGWPFTAIAG